MLDRQTLIALLVATTAGFAMAEHARGMLHDGTSLAQGGGWTAAILTELLVSMGAVAVALY